MNLSEINWDIEESGTWPTAAKALVIVFVCIVLAVVGFYFDTLPQIESLEGLEKSELDLKAQFEDKQKKSANLQDYRDQLTEIENSLSVMIKQMPTREEVASLLIDISQTGLASGLEFRLFKPESPIPKDFYSELPITIQVVGTYEELSLFISGLSTLPRIVTVHDVKITPTSKGDKKDIMVMDALVKTYNEKSTEASGAKSLRVKE